MSSRSTRIACGLRFHSPVSAGSPFHLASLLAIAFTLVILVPGQPEAAGGSDLELLSEGSSLAGFTLVARYESDGRAIGVRCRHDRTGMPVDLLRFDTTPQAMAWVRTIPPSNGGEPHTGEHLVLGKGTKGRLYSLLTDMSIGSHSASTGRDKTSYHFHTAGGRQLFLELTYRLLDALVHPDFTDEEIRREVCHLGVTADETTGQLSLEEKGTVYVEMVSSFEKPGTIVWSGVLEACYGEGHPLALESGGRPDAIREVEPQDIRDFFADCYRPGPGLGLIVALPASFPLEATLSDLDGVLRKVSNGSSPAPRDPLEDLPPMPLTLPGTIEILPFPSDNPGTPCQAALAWAPRIGLTVDDRLALETLWHLLGGDESSYLHKDLIDRSLRVGPAGIAQASAFIPSNHGTPPIVWLSGVDPRIIRPDSLARVREIVRARIAWIVSLDAASPEYADLRARAENYLIASRRELLAQSDAPPRFGFRGTGDFWYRHLQLLNSEPGFAKDLLLEGSRARLRERMAAGNPWPQLISRLGLLAEPSIVAVLPDTTLPGRLAEEKAARLRAASAAIARRYGQTHEQEGLAAYRADFDATTAELRAIEERVARPAFLDDPPLSLDDLIDSRIDSLALATATDPPMRPRAPCCVNRFHGIALTDFGLYFDVTATARADLSLLALVPALITDCGAWEGETWLSFDELNQRLQVEVGSLSADYAAFPREEGGRVELAIYGSGLTEPEANAALGWARTLLWSATRLDSLALPRVRVVVARDIAALRQRMMGSEETWARTFPQGYRFDRDPVFLSATSIFTRLHHLNRLSWLLHEVPPAAELAVLREAIAGIGTRAGQTRAQARGALDALRAPSAPALVREAAGYLAIELETLPPETLRQDLDLLAEQVLRDVAGDPRAVLARAAAFVQGLLARGPARVHLTASPENEPIVARGLTQLVAELGWHRPGSAAVPEDAPPARLLADGAIAGSLRARHPEIPAGERPCAVALVHEASRNGLFANSAPLVSYEDTGESAALDYLAAKSYSGNGGHTLFMQTWAAGLAYSNGVRAGARDALVHYYAERCSDASATMRFVTGLLEKADETLADAYLLDYALAKAFDDYRAADTYLSRGRAMAADWADGVAPETVRDFKEGLLALRRRWRQPEAASAILAKLRSRLPGAIGPVLLGYGAEPWSKPGSVIFLIGPEAQIALADQLLPPAGSATARAAAPASFVRLHARDFWIDASGAF